MRERIQKFMLGRYGADYFGRFLSFLSLGILIIALVVGDTAGAVLWVVALVLLIYCCYRMISKNTGARRAENNRYMGYRNRVFGFFRAKKERFSQRKDYCFYNCPQCGVTNRVPRGKGKIRITCPKCGNSFIRKS